MLRLILNYGNLYLRVTKHTHAHARTFMNCIATDLYLLAQYCSCDKIEKNEMGGACSAYGG